MIFEKENNKGMTKVMKAYKGFKYNKNKNTLHQFIDFINEFLEDPLSSDIFELSLNFSAECIVYTKRDDNKEHTGSLRNHQYLIKSLFKDSQKTEKQIQKEKKVDKKLCKKYNIPYKG